jgi:carbon-monoxide dehydrogenase large subunit
MDPVEIGAAISDPRRRLSRPSAAGLEIRGLSHHAALDKLLKMMDYHELRDEQARLRERGIHRGIGSPRSSKSPIPAGVLRRRRRAHFVPGRRAVRLDAAGSMFCHSSITEQGQGSESMTGADRRDRVRRADRARAGHHSAIPTIRPMAAAPGPRAAPASAARRRWQAGKALRKNVLAAAAAILQADPEGARHRAGIDRRRGDGAPRIESMRSPASSISAPTPCRPTSSRADGDAPLRAAQISVRLHQRRSGVLARSRYRGPASSSCSALGGRGLRHA